MKKQIKIIILTLFISILGTLNVNAASLKFGNIGNISQGTTEKLEILLNKETSETIKNISFDITINDIGAGGFKLVKSNDVSGTVKSLNAVLSSDNINSGKIATLDITNYHEHSTNKTIEIKIINIKIDETMSPDVSKSVTLSAVSTTTPKPKSNNAALSSLSFSAGTITPKFISGTTSYKVFGIKDTIKTVTINTQCDNCSYVIKCELGCNNAGNQKRPNLEIGKNIIKISTRSESGDNNLDYTFIVYRGETTDNSSLLQSITPEGFKLNEKFDSKSLDYTLSVPNDLEDLVLEAIPEDSTAQVEIKGNTNLIVGENVVTITVTSSETQDKSIYNIVVTRLEEGEIIVTTTAVITDTSSKNKSNTLILILLIIAGLAVIGAAAYFIFFKNKKKTPKKDLIKSKLEEPIISTGENELIDELNITDKKEKTTIDEALADIMNTKELILNNEDQEKTNI